jgi:hypothetical protein
MALPKRLFLIACLLAAGSPASMTPDAGAGNPLGPSNRVKKSWPAADLTGITTDPIVVQFKRPVELLSIDSETFSVRAGSEEVDGTVAYAVKVKKKGEKLITKQVIFTPDEPLPASTLISVDLTTDILTDRGRTMSEPFSFRYLTSSQKSEQVITPLPEKLKLVKAPKLGPPPTVIWTFPQLGLGNVFSDEVRVRFNKALLASSVTESNIRLLQGDLEVPGTLTLDSTKEVLFQPAQPLFPSSQYEIVVSTELKTAKGRPLQEEFRGGFGTSPFKDGVTPLDPSAFQDGANLATGRAYHTASPVGTGDVLVVGGQTFFGSSVERYRRSQAQFETVMPMSTPRRKHAATVLKDGRVFVCGGYGTTGFTQSSAEIYDPQEDTWTGVTPMTTSRSDHTATTLGDGRVLIAGGFTTGPNGLAFTGSSEIFNPSTGTWAQGPILQGERGGHTATLLSDGTVLLVGGVRFGDLIAEVFRPSSNTSVRTAGDPLFHRIFHAAEVTGSGTVLLAGGGPGQGEQYNPSTGRFTSAGGSAPFGLPVSESASWPTLTRLDGERVLYMGGLSFGGAPGNGDLVLQELQIWGPDGGGGNGAFQPMLFDMDVPRAAHTITTLADGRYLIVGGFGTVGNVNESRSTILDP